MHPVFKEVLGLLCCDYGQVGGPLLEEPPRKTLEVEVMLQTRVRKAGKTDSINRTAAGGAAQEAFQGEEINCKMGAPVAFPTVFPSNETQ